MWRGHLENAPTLLKLVERGSGDSSWSATARKWIECCEGSLTPSQRCRTDVGLVSLKANSAVRMPKGDPSGDMLLAPGPYRANWLLLEDRLASSTTLLRPFRSVSVNPNRKPYERGNSCEESWYPLWFSVAS